MLFLEVRNKPKYATAGKSHHTGPLHCCDSSSVQPFPIVKVTLSSQTSCLLIFPTAGQQCLITRVLVYSSDLGQYDEARAPSEEPMPGSFSHKQSSGKCILALWDTSIDPQCVAFMLFKKIGSIIRKQIRKLCTLCTQSRSLTVRGPKLSDVL